MTDLEQLRADLAEIERRYQLSSAEFFRRYRAGQTDDRMDYVEWASLVQMAENASLASYPSHEARSVLT
jgi:hypothetical protein